MTTFLPELVAMQAIADAVNDLTPSQKTRIANWLMEYVKEEVAPEQQPVETETMEDASPLAAAAPAESYAPEPELPASFVSLFDAVMPKTGAQKAAVAGYWLEEQGQDWWKASEANSLLKSIDVHLSSISIVLTNAVKVSQPLIEELERLGTGQRARKTFRLSSAGRTYVERCL